jgi:hypothetical protein
MRASSSNQISILSAATPFSARFPPGARGDFFKILDRALGLGVMLGARRQLAVAQRPQFPAYRLFGDGDAKLLEHPMAQIDKTPAHEAVRGWDRPALDHGGERRPVRVVEPRGLARRFAVDQAIRAVCIEPHHPVADDLARDAANLGGLLAAGAFINGRQGQQAPRLRRILRAFGRNAHGTRIKICSKGNRHGEPPGSPVESNKRRFGNRPPSQSFRDLA